VTRRSRAFVTIASAALLSVVAGPGVGATVTARSIGAAVRAASPAQTPFRGLTTTTVHVGGRALPVVLARTDPQRQRGLRRRSDLGRYGGMLFVFSGNTNVGFTMSTVPAPLDIGFYRSDGRAVDALRMVPCAGTDASCPVYRARGTFRYALETLAGALPSGALGG
jgi:uncharacterized membrane protein (UPF0127 family)